MENNGLSKLEKDEFDQCHFLRTDLFGGLVYNSCCRSLSYLMAQRAAVCLHGVISVTNCVGRNCELWVHVGLFWSHRLWWVWGQLLSCDSSLPINYAYNVKREWGGFGWGGGCRKNVLSPTWDQKESLSSCTSCTVYMPSSSRSNWFWISHALNMKHHTPGRQTTLSSLPIRAWHTCSNGDWAVIWALSCFESGRVGCSEPASRSYLLFSFVSCQWQNGTGQQMWYAWLSS